MQGAVMDSVSFLFVSLSRALRLACRKLAGMLGQMAAQSQPRGRPGTPT